VGAVCRVGFGGRRRLRRTCLAESPRHVDNGVAVRIGVGRKYICAWAAASLIAAVLSSSHAHGQGQPLAIDGARLTDGTGAPPVDDAVVVTDGDRIVAAGPRARVQIPRGAMVVDARGRVLLPGLVDVHCHINQPPDDMKRYWIAQLRWGVTTMRSA